MNEQLMQLVFKKIWRIYSHRHWKLRPLPVLSIMLQHSGSTE